MINRGVVVVYAREPFREWLQSLPNPCHLTLEEINEDRTAYLIPEFEDEQEQEKALKKVYVTIFENELADWWTREDDWPRKRDLRTFRKWFEPRFHGIVEDLVPGELVDDGE